MSQQENPSNNELSQVCKQCKSGQTLGFDIVMAFQPIVDLSTFSYYGYEALVRGPNGEGAGQIFEKVNDKNRYLFDQTCRKTAIHTAAELGLSHRLSINFMPNAVYEPSQCIRTTLQAAKEANFPLDKIVFEFTENEKIVDKKHLENILKHYNQRGFGTAIDDFGVGYSNLSLLCDVKVQVIKVDRSLIIDIDQKPRNQHFLKNLLPLLTPVSDNIVIEGVETFEELQCLYQMGYRTYQGFYFARPEIKVLPEVDFDKVRSLLKV